MTVEMFLHEIPPILIYIAVGLVTVWRARHPFHGEIMLVSAPCWRHAMNLDISVSGSRCRPAGAIIGDTIGYFIRAAVGKPLFTKLGRRFPKHFSPAHVAFAERIFGRWGVYAVYSAGSSHCCGSSTARWPARSDAYYKFLAANIHAASSGPAGHVRGVYSSEVARRPGLKRFSWDRAGRGPGGRSDHRLAGETQRPTSWPSATPRRDEEEQQAA